MVDWQVVVTSAAVGAVASSIANLFGQKWERAARQREVAFTASIEMANRRLPLAMDAAKRGSGGILPDAPALMATYFRWLHELITTGKVPEEMRRQEQELTKLEAERDANAK